MFLRSMVTSATPKKEALNQLAVERVWSQGDLPLGVSESVETAGKEIFFPAPHFFRALTRLAQLVE